jgi:hypothetical protein
VPTGLAYPHNSRSISTMITVADPQPAQTQTRSTEHHVDLSKLSDSTRAALAQPPFGEQDAADSSAAPTTTTAAAAAPITSLLPACPWQMGGPRPETLKQRAARWGPGLADVLLPVLRGSSSLDGLTAVMTGG